MPRVLIAGAGYVGAEAAHLFAAGGWEVLALVRSPESLSSRRSAAFPIVAGDITNAAEMRALGAFDCVVDAVSSGRGGAEAYRRNYLEGARVLLETLQPGHFIFTSSTSVYAQNDGRWVTEESPAEPDRETGQILRETEELVLAHQGTIARLAGIYGPARSMLLRKMLEGTAVIEGDGQRWVNQIHRDDAARALVLLATRKAVGIFNVVDDEPLPQTTLYAQIATHLQRPLPPSGPVDPARKRGVTNKRVSNARLRALGWAPEFPTFLTALACDSRLAEQPPARN